MRTRILFSLLMLFAAPPFVRAAEEPTEKDFTNSLGMKMVRIEAGRFQMGLGEKSVPDALLNKREYLRNGNYDEHPTHPVTISRSFFMGVFEVTNEQFEQFDPKHKKLRGKLKFSNNNDEAVVFVNWNEAAAFCRWLSKKEGLPYRLPTEAQWEYACRGGNHADYSFGDNAEQLGDYAWYYDNSDNKKHPVGQKKPNSWRLCDMHGNVFEWCRDWYQSELPGDSDPEVKKEALSRVLRGGCWLSVAARCRSAHCSAGRFSRLAARLTWLRAVPTFGRRSSCR